MIRFFIQKLIKKFTCVVVGVALFASAGAALGLPAEMEMDRLMLAAEGKLAKRDYDAARTYLERIGELKLQPQAKFHFLAGQVALHYGELDKAQQHLSEYVEQSGRETDLYEPALEMITQIEEKLQDQQAAQESRAQVKEIKTASGIQLTDVQGLEYDKSIQKLYLGRDVESALVLHVNSLLKSYMYLEGRVKNLATSNRLEYGVSVKAPSQVLVSKTEKNPAQSGQSAISTSSLDAYGVNPFVSYRCSKAADKCFIKHPVNGKDWMVIAYDEGGAAELSQALTRLIKALQR
ncbi:MAG: hypothetical protein MI808_22145 [Pseudomonadales bacterium]|nr:hypothetical protein [Pseudomonadales bacterium]